jgi:hypothetical protein
VAVRCSRITPARSDELVARIHLAIHSADASAAPASINVECDDQATRVAWDVPPTEELEVDESGGLVEGVLDAVDRRLVTFRDRSARQSVTSRAAPPTPAETPDLTIRRVRIPTLAQRRVRRAGGLGLALTVEPWPDEKLGMGPRLDLGVGIGPVVAVSSEGFRLGVGDEHSSFLFDVAMGAGWGAPFDPARAFGAVALLGIEYFSAFRAETGPNSSQTVATATATLGIRGSIRAGPTAVWLGLDGRYRPDPPEFGAPFHVALGRLSALFSVGVLLLADPN